MQLSAAATGKLVAAIRILHRVGRNGRGAQLRNQIAILSRLACRQLQTLVLGLEVRELALREEVEDCAAVAVGVVDDVAGRVLHRVPGIASLSSHVIPHALDAALGVAAALSGLHLHCSQLLHESRLLVTAGELSLRKAVGHRHVGAVDKLRLLVKSVAKPLIYTVDLALDIGKVRGQHVAVDHAAGIASVVAPAVAAPAAECEQEQNDKPSRAVTAKPKATAIGRLHRHGQHGGAAIGKRHSITPFN